MEQDFLLSSISQRNFTRIDLLASGNHVIGNGGIGILEGVIGRIESAYGELVKRES